MTWCFATVAWLLATVVAGAGNARAQVVAANTDTNIISGGSAKVTTTGLIVTVDNAWAENPGYRPLRVTIKPIVPPSGDRNVSVIVVGTGQWQSGAMITVEEEITVPAGATVVHRTIPIPRAGCVGDYHVTLLEDGLPLKMPHPLQVPATGESWELRTGTRFPRMLIVGDQLPDTSVLGQYYGAAAYRAWNDPFGGPTMGGGQTNQKSTKVTVPPLPSAFTVSSAELPTEWIDYTCLDVVCLSLDQLGDLVKKQPDTVSAILRWTESGGTLWVFGTGDGGRRLAELDALLGFESSTSRETPKPGATSPPSSQARRAAIWREPSRKKYGDRPDWIQWDHGSGTVTVAEMHYDDKDQLDALWRWSKNPPKKAPKAAPFRYRDFGFGRVIAMDAADPFPGEPWQWGWIASTMGDRASWADRHGFSYVDLNPDFWKFLVPGMGLAPVTEFRVLISVFVVLIGPVNYYMLRRRKRLHLLVLTIPGGALLVTGVLFGYALISDGLSVKLRTRSVTRIDQRRGESVCWGWLSYYAGLAPHGGLSFSEETAVYPFVSEPSDGEGTSRFVAWNEAQQLTRGWLASRTPTQYFTIRPQATTSGLKIATKADQAGTLRVKNHLGAAIRSLVIRAHDGRYYRVSALDDGASTGARLTTELEASDELSGIFRDHSPALPPGIAQGQQMQSHLFGIHPMAFWGRGQSMASIDTSLMERSLDEASKPGGMPPGSYVAVVGDQPALELGTPVVEEQGSFHVVLGEW